MSPAEVVEQPPKVKLVCGNELSGGLTQKEVNDFAAAINEMYTSKGLPVKSIWEPYASGLSLVLPWKRYNVAAVGVVPFNGCSSSVIQGFGDFWISITNAANLKSAYDTGTTPSPVWDWRKFRLYCLYSLMLNIGTSKNPWFLNMPPEKGHGYEDVNKWLLQNAQVACRFVNPNYPDRGPKHEYTTLYCFDAQKWASGTSYFKGLIK